MAKTCRRSGGKLNYRSPKAAEVALEKIAEYAKQQSFKRNYVKVETDYYKCPYCPYWHLTSLRQTGKRAGE